jgi:transcriptional regulator with XRE-family HTH domain
MDPAAAIRLARVRSRLSQRELARRAHTSPAAISFYESGAREPSYGTLTRIIAAAGYEPRLSVRRTHRPDRTVQGARLVDVLELAEHLPRRAAAPRMNFPPFAR